MNIFKINEKHYFDFLDNVIATPDKSLEINTVFYHSSEKSFAVEHEAPLEIARIMVLVCKKAISNTLILPDFISPYKAGYASSKYTHNFVTQDKDYDICFKITAYILFNINYTKVWLYNHNNKIIMEISPSYPWHYLDPKDDEQFETFEQFMTNYKPIAIHEISKETAQEWLKQAQDYLDIVEPQFEQWCKEHKDELYYLKEDA